MSGQPIRKHGKILDMQDDGSLKFECDELEREEHFFLATHLGHEALLLLGLATIN